MHAAAKDAIAGADATRWVRYTVHEKTGDSYRQAGPGLPGPGTACRRIEKKAFQVTCDVDITRVAYDAVTDGCWPLITNDKDMTGAQVLAAYRYQPNLERRHHLLKGIQDAAPVWIKTIPRIEAACGHSAGDSGNSAARRSAADRPYCAHTRIDFLDGDFWMTSSLVARAPEIVEVLGRRGCR